MGLRVIFRWVEPLLRLLLHLKPRISSIPLLGDTVTDTQAVVTRTYICHARTIGKAEVVRVQRFFYIWTSHSGFYATAAEKWRVPMRSRLSHPQGWNVTHIGGQWVLVSLKDSHIQASGRAVNFQINPVCCPRGCNYECGVVNVEKLQTV